MFLNKPVRRPGEGDQHFKAKVRVAKIADRYFKECFTKYEHDFEPVNKYEYGLLEVCYSADILVAIMWKGAFVKMLNIEIDGIKNHNSKINKAKDKARDKRLAKNMPFSSHDFPTFPALVYFPVIVRRHTSDLKNIDDSDIIGELRLDSL